VVDNALVISTLEVTAGGNGIKSNLAIEVVSQSSLAAGCEQDALTCKRLILAERQL
jgi:hypothetical protein